MDYGSIHGYCDQMLNHCCSSTHTQMRRLNNLIQMIYKYITCTRQSVTRGLSKVDDLKFETSVLAGEVLELGGALLDLLRVLHEGDGHGLYPRGAVRGQWRGGDGRRPSERERLGRIGHNER